MKVVINRCYGGYSLSRKAYRYLGLPEAEYRYGFAYKDDRTNPKLVECVEVLGKAASGIVAELVVVTIPDDVKWTLEEYDGIEHVAEVHRVWP